MTLDLGEAPPGVRGLSQDPARWKDLVALWTVRPRLPDARGARETAGHSGPVKDLASAGGQPSVTSTLTLEESGTWLEFFKSSKKV